MIHQPFSKHKHNGLSCVTCHVHVCPTCDIAWLCQDEGDHGSVEAGLEGRHLDIAVSYPVLSHPPNSISSLPCSFHGPTPDPTRDGIKYCGGCGSYFRVPSPLLDRLKPRCDVCRGLAGYQSVRVGIERLLSRTTSSKCRCNRCSERPSDPYEDDLGSARVAQPPDDDDEVASDTDVCSTCGEVHYESNR